MLDQASPQRPRPRGGAPPWLHLVQGTPQACCTQTRENFTYQDCVSAVQHVHVLLLQRLRRHCRHHCPAVGHEALLFSCSCNVPFVLQTLQSFG